MEHENIEAVWDPKSVDCLLTSEETLQIIGFLDRIKQNAPKGIERIVAQPRTRIRPDGDHKLVGYSVIYWSHNPERRVMAYSVYDHEMKPLPNPLGELCQRYPQKSRREAISRDAYYLHS